MGLGVGSFVRHGTMGVGVVVAVRDDKVDVVFDTEEKTYKTAWVQANCAPVLDSEVPPDSPLRQPATPPPAKRVTAKRKVTRNPASTCPHCANALNRARYSADKSLKSCPRCSVEHGVHVFHAHPDAFGTTDARVTDATPDGVQSYCSACRIGETPPSGTPCPSVSQ
jgi:hypothetical protein